MRHDKEGNPLYKRVFITIELPGQKPRKLTFKAPPGRGWNPEGIDNLLDQAEANLEQRPLLGHKLVELAPNEFKFVLTSIAGRKLDGAAPLGVIDVRRMVAEMPLEELLKLNT